MSTIAKIAGHPQKITRRNKTGDQVEETINNGPHNDAKWARRLLGTPTQAEVRRASPVYQRYQRLKSQLKSSTDAYMRFYRYT